MLGVDHHIPKISCLMVTADGRMDYFRQSFQCFVEQSYPNKELVVVTDASPEYKRQISDCVSGRSDVHLVFLKGTYTLGALRNISILICSGDLFVQWDDDDFNMPDRLMIQYGHLSKSGHRICYLGDQLHYYFPTQQLFWENWWEYQSNATLRYGLIPGTIMAFRDGFPARYPSCGTYARSGEDTVLSNALCSTEEITLLKGWGDLQIYSYHGKNVWDLEHHINISKHRSESVSFMNKYRERICRTLQHMKFSPTVRVMGREGLSFMYEVDHAD